MSSDPRSRDTSADNAAHDEDAAEDVLSSDLEADEPKVKKADDVHDEADDDGSVGEDETPAMKSKAEVDAEKETDEHDDDVEEAEEEEELPRQRPKRKAAQKSALGAKKAKKEGEEKGKKSGASGFSKPVRVSEELAVFLGQEEISRPELTKFMWAYFKENGLQDPTDRRVILADEKLKGLLKVDRFNAFGFMKLVKPHLIG